MAELQLCTAVGCSAPHRTAGWVKLEGWNLPADNSLSVTAGALSLFGTCPKSYKGGGGTFITNLLKIGGGIIILIQETFLKAPGKPCFNLLFFFIRGLCLPCKASLLISFNLFNSCDVCPLLPWLCCHLRGKIQGEFSSTSRLGAIPCLGTTPVPPLSFCSPEGFMWLFVLRPRSGR